MTRLQPLTRLRLGVSCALVALVVLLVAGCGGSDDGRSNEVVLVTHDSFAIPKQVKAAFERESGLKLRILQGGDAGEMLNRALLTKGNPQGDAIFGDRQQPALARSGSGPARAVRGEGHRLPSTGATGSTRRAS